MAEQQSKKKSMGEGSTNNLMVTPEENAAGEGWEQIPFVNKPVLSLTYSSIITALFFVVVLFGLVHHEMWRDELQAWLVARDAHSIPELFKNMRYEGNPALWHFFLFLITRFTHNPAYMQALHLLIACGFIFVFNRYAEIKTPFKIMFSFGYFTLYEYSVISRSYGLAILLIFVACALYKNRSRNYILMGIVLALLANVTIYGVIFALGIYGILFLECLIARKENNADLKRVVAGAAIMLCGVILSLYQIVPDKDNTFQVRYADHLFDMDRWAVVFSRICTTYFYMPKIAELHFWNTNIFFTNELDLYGNAIPFGDGDFSWAYVLLPSVVLFISVIVFMRKPMVLLLYTGVTLGLLSVYYYTNLLFLRYCGFLLILFIVCLWLEPYCKERQYSNPFLVFLSMAGTKIRNPFLAAMLIVNIAGAAVAYSKDYTEDFSTSKKAADFIRENKLDTLTMAGMNHYIISPLAAYLDTKIYYPQRNEFGSFTIFDNHFKWSLTGEEINNALQSLLPVKNSKILVVLSYKWTVTSDGGQTFANINHVFMNGNLKVDLLQSIDAGIVSDEQYNIYTVQKIDTLDYMK